MVVIPFYTTHLTNPTALQAEVETTMTNVVRNPALTVFPTFPVAATDDVCEFHARIRTALTENSAELEFEKASVTAAPFRA